MGINRRFGAHDPRTWLERSGALFQKYEAFAAAAGAFSRLIDLEPEYVPAREGLASVLGALPQDQVDAAEAFTAEPAELAERIGWTETTFAEAMVAIPLHGQRMQIVMWLGTLNEPCGVEILLTALDDDNVDVRMAALKRLEATDDRRVVAKLEQLATEEAGRDSEPYLSMALRRFLKDETDPGHWAVPLLESLEKERPPAPRMNPQLFFCPPSVQ